MADRAIAFQCWHQDCAKDPALEIVVNAPVPGTATQGTKKIERYCERGHLNIITLPNTWAVRPLVLGDAGVITEQNGVPVLQGRKL